MHGQHKAVGDVLRSIEYPGTEPGTELLLDAACGGKGSQIRLYGHELGGRRSSLAYIDAALVVNGEIKVVVEIEYSNVRPLYLCGKVFATALEQLQRSQEGQNPSGRRNDVCSGHLISRREVGKTIHQETEKKFQASSMRVPRTRNQ
jgi:hypothetical protein